MLSSYYTLSYIVSNLQSRIRAWTISALYTQEKDELVIGFHDRPESLILLFRTGMQTLYLQRSTGRAKRNTVDIFNTARHRTIAGVASIPGERVVRIELDDGTTIAAELYGPHANAFLLDASGIIADSFKRASDRIGSPFTHNPADLSFDSLKLEEALRLNPASAPEGAIRRAIPHFGAVLSREAVLRAGLLRGATCADLTQEQRDEVRQAIMEILSALRSPAPRIYTGAGDGNTIFSLLPLHQGEGMKEEVFGDIQEAVHAMVARNRSALRLGERKLPLLAALRQGVTRARRAIEAMEDGSRGAERADAYERFGSLLISHLPEFGKGDTAATIVDAGGEVVIPLDPSLSAAHNAQRYFAKAKRARASAREAGTREGALRRRVVLGEQLLNIFEAADSRDSVRELMKTHTDELRELGIDARERPTEPLPFRIFIVDGGFEVWAGKSSTNNDLLTLKHARPNDLWFHARGASGSHVVLKTGTGHGEPGKKAKEQAAGIAAYYSKMRNASMVPVAMTERKYVRKPKGASPGSVTLEKEKVIFAEPGLPVETAKSHSRT